jgi:hypothetical protein
MDDQVDRRAGLGGGDAIPEVGAVLDHLAVELHDDVVSLQPRAVGRAPFLDTRDDDAGGVLRQAEPLDQVLVDVVDIHADPAAGDLPSLIRLLMM